MAHCATLPILLKQLKLSTMAALWESYLDKAIKQGLDPAQFLAALCEEELNQRYSSRIARYFKESRLPVGKTLSSFDFSHLPELETGRMEALSSDPSWVKRSENLLFFGPSGTGKTHLAVAICNGLIEQGVRVRYYQATALVQELQRARDELQLEKLFARLDKYSVLILDDIGYVRKSESETHVLFELIAHRYESRSMIITANHPFSDWDQIFSDTMMTVAAIDRFVHHAIIIEIQAESFRKKEAISRNRQVSTTIPTKKSEEDTTR
ncbi:MAG: IS21-like element helper ATPase IstB [Proteobacteria bacterium]|nr:IS21-like element helper ATPase IstB [Pseudomonadota bacterium]MBU1058404.1 IS21-like element helper ATPase IstB [Pseudomonadota bacterium]